ncbi:LysM peptidoglycan-binding domain-containing M23 family metallopeptidase [Ornatilinea apprima]|uniref:LysM peptidoglycan-binding domain-containing M23 family metallopeptidase n=1 Tax=Ornatilinea apprima TaxID=1134406 RepID=UPI0009466FAE|nr:LysM peptidoglycan-binding domain-containing M23 family metallopeptidase [Ornatilinea apprima]
MKYPLNRLNKTISAIILSIIILGASLSQNVSAQEIPVYPTYIVQSGDTLGSIASLFGVTLQELINFNNLTDPNQLAVGDVLKVPAFEGIGDTLTIQTVGLGENLPSLAIKYGVSQEQIILLNRLTSPTEIYAGTQLILPIVDQAPSAIRVTPLAGSQSVFGWSAAQAQNPWSISHINAIPNPERIVPGQSLFANSNETSAITSFSTNIKSINITPLPLQQGVTTSIEIQTTAPVEISGKLGSHDLHFFPTGDNQYTALQGIEATIDPGLYDFSISSTDNSIHFNQPVLLVDINYGQGAPLDVDPRLIDPTVTEPEEKLVRQITGVITPEKYWDGQFVYPIDEPCVSAGYGSDREYNGGVLKYYHTGIDFAVCANNLNIYAPAGGKVVFAGPLEVRGNAVILDHGQGIFSGFWHQSEIMVSVGDFLSPGQQIGLIGTTGRSTGPHLHWEVWVNGVQVNPYDWVVNVYP